jgi:hypothetical protein
VAQLYLRALGSLYVASRDSQGYGGGILTLPQPGSSGPQLYIPQEQDGPVQSHATTGGLLETLNFSLFCKLTNQRVPHHSS